MRIWGGKRTPLRWRDTLPLRRQAPAKGSIAGVLIAAMFLLAAPVASAAPANDRLEDAQPLGPALPVEETGLSNEGAGWGASEDPWDVYAARRSVWFRWEAESTELVTVDTCGSSFAAILMVFDAVEPEDAEDLKEGEVGRDYNGGTPACAVGQGAALTFEAEAGATYWILVDGNGFHLEGPPPVTQGTFSLRIESTPVPSNDDFEDATPLESRLTEEPDGARFCYASVQGYNWNATKQVGEPDHGGDPGGASVWFDWTAPQAGAARIDACASADSLLGVYTGDSVAELTPVPGERLGYAGSPLIFPCNLAFQAVAGATYRIAVDGKLDSGDEMPWMDKFWLSASLSVPAPPVTESGASGPAPAAPPRVPLQRAPKTRLFEQVLRRKPPIYVFRFRSSEPGSTFRCKLDKRRLRRCRSPLRLRHLEPGRHVLRVFAVDAAGNRDRSPAVARFKVKRYWYRPR